MIDITKELIEGNKLKVRNKYKTFSDGSKLKLYQFTCDDKNINLDSVLFIMKDSGYYEPYIYNYSEENDKTTGIIIKQGTLMFEWVMAVNKSLSRYNVKTRTTIKGSLDILQWVVSITTINAVVNNTGETIQIEGSRQWGKTYLGVFISAFIAVIAPKFIDNENDRFWFVVCSYSIISCGVIWGKVIPEVKKMITYYNERFPNEKLIYGKQGEKYKNKKNLTDSSIKFDINLVIGNEVYPYTEMHNIPAGTTRDGLSMNFCLADEPQFFPTDLWGGIKRFGASSNPVFLLTGITSVETDNVQYMYHNIKEDYVKTYNIPVHLSYQVKNLCHKKRANDVIDFFEKEVQQLGINHTEIMVNYLMGWDIINGKFMTEDLMNRNGLLKTDIFTHIDDKAVYRVAGMDVASQEDYCTLVITDVYLDKENTYRYEVRSIHTFNPKQEKLGDIEVAQKATKILNTYQVDMIMLDTTGHQHNYAEKLYIQLEKEGVNTFVINYNFSGHTQKIKMFSYLESGFLSSKVLLPKIEYKNTDFSYGILYKELLTLKKHKKKGKNNIQYEAIKPDTDDHVDALALSVYCIHHLEHLIRTKKAIEFSKYRYNPKFNKFSRKKMDLGYDPNKLNFSDKPIIPNKYI